MIFDQAIAHMTLSDFFDKCPEILKIFRAILYLNAWEIVYCKSCKIMKIS